MFDILARIAAAVGCQQCGGPLDSSPSDDFCTEACQDIWRAQRVIVPTEWREPWGRSQDYPRIDPDSLTRAGGLPAETEDLFADWWVAQAVLIAATTDEQRSAVQARLESLTTRKVEQVRVAIERIWSAR